MTGLTNKTLTVTGYATQGRAATEEQLVALKDSLGTAITQASTVLARQGTNTAVTGDGTTASPYVVNVNSTLEHMTEIQLDRGTNKGALNGGGLYMTASSNIDSTNPTHILDPTKEVRTALNGMSAGMQTVDNVQSAISLQSSGNTFLEKLTAAATSTTPVNTDTQGAVSNSAVTVGDLYNTVNGLTANGLDFVGNDSTNKVHRDLGTTLSITGGLTNVATGVSNQNLGVRRNTAGDGLELVMSENPEFTTVKTGDTTMSNSGIVINNGNGDESISTDKVVSITKDGLNNGGNVITNVADGLDDTDAVNMKQLGQAVAENITVVDGSKNVTVTEDTDYYDEGNGYKFVVGLNDNITLGDETNAPDKAININGTAGTITVGTGVESVSMNGTTGTVTAGTVNVGGTDNTVTGLTNKTWVIGTTEPVSGRAATEDQLKIVSDGVKAAADFVGQGLKFKGDSAAVITKQLGEQVDITGGKTTDLSDGNIGVVSDGTKLNVKLAKTLTGLDSVTAGGTTINSEGLTVGGKNYVTTTGIDANNQTITNVASGGNTTTNAANIGDVTRIAAANDKYVTGGTVSYGTDGQGSMALAGTNNLSAPVTGLHDYYVTSASTADDGKTATLTRNDNQTFTLDLTNTIKSAADQAAATEQTTTLANGSNTTVVGVTTGNNTEYKVNVNTDSTTLTTTGNSLSAVTTALTAGGTGTVAATAGNALVTGSAVANAINSAGWQLAGPDGSKNLITAGSTVNFRNGKGSTANVASVSGEYAVSYDVNVDGSTIKIGDDGKLTVNTSAVDTDTVTTIASGDQTVKVTKGANDANGNTTYDVKVNTGSTLKKDGTTGAIDVNTGSGLTVGSDGTINVATTTLTTAGGKVSAGTADSYATAGSVATAINNASFNVIAGTNSTGAATTAVKAGDTVTFNAGSNLNVTQAGSQFTYGLNSDLTGIKTISNTKTDSATETTTGTKLTLSDESNTVDLNGAQVTNMASGGTIDNHGANIKDVKDMVKAAAAQGLDFAGNDGSVHRDLGSTLSIKGGLTDVTAGVSNKNLGMKKNSAGDGLEVVMSENPGFTTVTAGTDMTKQVIIGDDGVSVGGNAYITNTGINANSKKITNVADGTATTDAVNYGQLAAVKTTVAGGLNFSGDVSADTALANTFNRSLGQETKIVGGVTDTALLSDGNIGIISNGVDTLKVKLAKDLQGLTSVRTGNTLMNTNGIAVSSSAADSTKKVTLTNAGLDNGGNKIVNVADGLVEAGSKEAINGGQLQGVIDGITDAAQGGFGFFDDKGTKVQQDLGKQVTFQGANGITVSGDNEYKTMTIGLSNDVSVGSKGADGADGKISVSGKSGAGIVLNGADGSIALNGANGADVVSIRSGQGASAVDGTDGATKTRLMYTDGTGTNTVATLDDGMKYAGDSGTAISKKLNGEVNVIGGLSDESLLTTEDNLGVVSDGTDNLKVRLAKNLKGLNSVDLEDESGNYNAITTTGYEVGNDTSTVELVANGLTILPKDGRDSVSLTDEGLSNGGNKITNVKAGEAETDAVNVSQLNQVKTSVDRGFDFSGDVKEDGVSNNTFNRKSGQEIEIVGGIKDTTQLSDNNIGVVSNGDGVLTVKLAKELTGLKSIRTGDTLMTDTGITITGSTADETRHVGLTKSGLDNGGNKIINVADGDINKDSTDAINGRQLQKVIDGISSDATGGFGFLDDTGMKVQQNLGSQIKLNGHDGVTVTADAENKTVNLGLSNAVTVGGKKETDDSGNIIYKGGVVSVVGGNGNSGVTLSAEGAGGEIGADGRIGLTGKSSTGHSSIDIRTERGLDATANDIAGEVVSRIVYNDGVKDNTVATLDDGMKYAGDSGTVISKKLNGQVNVVGGVTDTDLLSDGNIGIVSNGIDSLTVKLSKDLQGLNSIDLADEYGNYNAITTTGYEVGDDTSAVELVANGLTILPKDGRNSVSLTGDGLDNGGNRIIDVASGLNGKALSDVTATDEEYTNAANIGDLKEAVLGITNGTGTGATGGFGLKDGSGNVVRQNLGGQIQIKGDGNIVTEVGETGTVMNVKLADQVTFGTGSDASKKVSVDGTSGVVKAGNVTVDGSSGVVDGLSNKDWDANHDYSDSGKAATEAQLQKASQAIQTSIKASKVSVTAGKNIQVAKTTTADGGTDYQISTSDDMTAKTFTAEDGNGNSTAVNAGGMTITPKRGKETSLTADGVKVNGNTYISKAGINANKQVITNVADGSVKKDSTDAVNGGQLYIRDVAIEKQGEAINKIANAVGDLNHHVNETGAMSAALAGLTPLMYDPLEPTQIMAGFGHYKDENAVALGVAHYANESTMLHIGASLSGGEQMINAGVTWKVGSSKAKESIPEKYRGGPISSVYVLQDEVTALKEENKALRAHNEQVEKDNADMKEKIDRLMKAVGLQ